MEVKEIEKLLSPAQISMAAIAITKIMIAKRDSVTMTYAESCRSMVLEMAPYVQFAMQPFTEDEIQHCMDNCDIDGAALGTFVDFAAALVEDRKQVLDPRSVKLNAIVAEIDAMASSGKKFEHFEAAELILESLERLEEINGTEPA